MSLLALFSLFTGIMLMPQAPIPVDTGTQILSGTASWYAYGIPGYPEWSDTHATCAFHHQYKDYGLYEVCNTDNGKCIVCKNNDFMRADRLVDLSNYAFSKLAPLSKGLIQVTVRSLDVGH